MKQSCSRSAGGCGFLFGVKETEVFCFLPKSNICLPLAARPVPTNPLDSAEALFLNPLIAVLLRVVCQPEVALGIIEPVTISMVNLNAIWFAHNEPVKVKRVLPPVTLN